MKSTLRHLDPRSKSFAALVMAGVSFLCFLPVLLWGLPTQSADLRHHLQITNAYVTTLEGGTILPDWVEAENGAYGSVTVRFYPPLIHITIALFKLVVLRMDLAIFAAFSLWSFVGSLGVYLWARELVGGTLGPLVGAILFAISPYHLNQVYNSFLFGEFVSLSVLPFAFFFTKRLADSGGAKNVIGLALSLSGLILSNIPQMVVCFPFLALYALVCLDRRRSVQQLMMLVASAILATALTAFYWIRVVAEMSWIHIAAPNTDANYDFRNNFLFNMTGASPSGIGFGSLMLLLVVVMVAGLLLVSGRYKSVVRDRQITAVMVILVISIFMVLPLSTFVWEAFEVLQRVQFPWRFLSIVSITASVIMAFGIAAIDGQSIRANRRVILVMAGCLLIFTTFSVRQVIMGAVFLETGDFNRVAESSSSSNGLYHWWPVWADKETFRERTPVLAGDRQVSLIRWQSDARKFSISPGHPATVRTAILYYPWWRVSVNGSEVETKSVGGALGFDIGVEEAACSLTFREPAYTGVSRMLSGLSILGIIMFMVISAFRRAPLSYE